MTALKLERTLEVKDVVTLLRAEVRKAGGISAWCRKTGVHRTVVSRVLHNFQSPTKCIIKALKLRTVFVSEAMRRKPPTSARG
jgi:hypothetical protein